MLIAFIYLKTFLSVKLTRIDPKNQNKTQTYLQAHWAKWESWHEVEAQQQTKP